MSSTRLLRAAALTVLTILGVACGQKAEGPPPRYAVLRFENVSGDQSIEWVCRAASEVLARSLEGAMDGEVLQTQALARVSGALGVRPAGTPGISSERSAALLAGASRLITGTVERSGGDFHLRVREEDLLTGKTVGVFDASAATGEVAISLIAKKIAPNAQPSLTANAEALRLYAVALESSPKAAVPALESAVDRDPAFGSAWVILARTQRLTGDRLAATDTVAHATNQRLTDVDRAELELEAADLKGDREGRMTALRRLSTLTPADTALLRSIAQADTSAGNFKEASNDWARLAKMMPMDGDVWNQLGYVRIWSGDYTGALEALKEYSRLRPNEPNPYDSTGDVHYSAGRFSEAAKAYQQAYAKDVKFQGGGELYKIAWALWRQGDKPGAEKAMQSFIAAREKTGAGSGTALFQADWLYRTGRTKEAIELLRKEVVNSPPTVKGAMYAQLSVWALMAGNRTEALQDIEAAGPVNSGGLLMAKFVALPSGSAADWESRASALFSGPMARPRDLALGYALLLDNKRQAAIPVWERVSNSASGTDFFARAVYAKLAGRKEVHEMVPDPTSVNQFAALLDKL